jgi:Trypsin-co-occurring domain 1
MPAPVVRYELDDGTVVGFEIEPSAGWHDVGSDAIVGPVTEAVGPAVDAAKAVLDKTKKANGALPDEIQVKFGIKVSGTMNWLVARATTEGNFEITLTWKPGPEVT